jgi:predicted aconitase
MPHLILTDQEKEVLAGRRGKGAAQALELVAAVGRACDAQRLLPVRSVHISGISFKNIGEAGLSFLKEILADVDAFVVPTTINPCGFDLSDPDAWDLDPEFKAKQKEIVDLLVAAGGVPLLTCTPYRAGVTVTPGDHLAWAESSAVSWANSMLGGRTNRTGGPEAVASAITGLTADYGLHRDENRLPTFRVDVSRPLSGARDFGQLGLAIGRIASGGIPLLRLHPKQTPARESELLAMAAAMAAAGSVPLFHIEGVTPPPPLPVDGDALPLRTADPDPAAEPPKGPPDLVAFGCPHASMADLRELASNLSGKKVGVTTWAMTSRVVREKARQDGTARALAKAGVSIVCDTCVVSAPLAELGFTCLATDSAKASVYCPTHCGVEVIFETTVKCLAMACGEAE